MHLENVIALLELLLNGKETTMTYTLHYLKTGNISEAITALQRAKIHNVLVRTRQTKHCLTRSSHLNKRGFLASTIWTTMSLDKSTTHH